MLELFCIQDTDPATIDQYANAGPKCVHIGFYCMLLLPPFAIVAAPTWGLFAVASQTASAVRSVRARSVLPCLHLPLTGPGVFTCSLPPGTPLPSCLPSSVSRCPSCTPPSSFEWRCTCCAAGLVDPRAC